MSSRHRKKLAQELLMASAKGEEEDDEAEEEEENYPQSKHAFMMYESESEEEDEDEEENPPQDDNEGSAETPTREITLKVQPTLPTGKKSVPNKGKAAKRGAKADNDDEKAFTELLVEAQSTSRANERDSSSMLFTLDAKALNIEIELKRHFGAMGRHMGDDEAKVPDRRQHKGRKSVQKPTLTARRCLLGAAKPHWPTPPSFIGGGIGMRRTHVPDYLLKPYFHRQLQAHDRADWFEFEWSADYHRVHERYMYVQQAHDPNRLAAFLAQFPYHVDGLLQLALIFARTGQMDHAHDYIRACAYVHECAYLEAFKPQLGLCRIDCSNTQNTPFFAALFRHMQITAMQGLVPVALEVSRLILALDPPGDPMCVLLCMDYYFVSCNRHDLLDLYHASELVVGHSPLQFSDESQFDILTALAASYSSPPVPLSSVKLLGLNPHELTIQDMPNWAFSKALSMLLRGDVELGIAQLTSAVLSYPMFVEPLLLKCDVSVDSSDWRSTLAHVYFSDGMRTSETRSSSSVLSHLSNIYATRCQYLWKGEGMIAHLYTACVKTIRHVAPQTSRYLTSLHQRCANLDSQFSALKKYHNTDIEDFSDAFARLPPDMNPLDPRIADPRVLFRRRPNQAMAGVRMPPVWQGDGNVIDQIRAHLQHLRPDFRENLLAALNRGGMDQQALHEGLLAQPAARPQIPGQGNLDPNLPLLQLFLQSLLPWNNVAGTGRDNGHG